MMEVTENPWAVNSIHDFSYFCCPDCEHKSQDKQSFVDHALYFHSKEFEVSQKMIKDDSLSDVIVPEDPELNVKSEDCVKDECPNSDLSDEQDISIESSETIVMKFPCWLCNYAPDKGSLLKTHARKMHKTQSRKDYPCPECGAN